MVELAQNSLTSNSPIVKMPNAENALFALVHRSDLTWPRALKQARSILD